MESFKFTSLEQVNMRVGCLQHPKLLSCLLLLKKTLSFTQYSEQNRGDFLTATGSGVHLAFYPMGNGVHFPGNKAPGAASLSHLVVMLVHKAYISSWW